MINQVGDNNSVRAFRDFSQPKNGYIIVPEQKKDDEQAPTQISDKIRSKIKGKAIGVSAVIVGFLTLGLMKGVMPKSFTKLLDKWKITLEKKVSLDKNTKNIYNHILDKLNKFRERIECVNNFTTLKDVGLQRLMYGKNGQRTFTRKIHEGITKIFDKISRNTVNSSYANTQKKFATLNEYMNALNDRIVRESSDHEAKKLVDSIKTKMVNVNKKFEYGFGLNARNNRLQQMNKAYEGLFDYFWNSSLKDIKNFKSKNMWSSYIAEDYLHADKKELVKSTRLLRKAISNNIDDDYFTSIETINSIRKFVNPNDIDTIKTIQDLRKSLLKYKKLSGSNAVADRVTQKQNILAKLKQLSTSINSEKYSLETVKKISEQINDVKSVISSSSKGELQEILSIYKKILSEKEYKQLKTKITKTIKSLDESIDTETNRYFDKARDLKLGSGPTDVMSILGTAGTIAWLVGKSKDKDEIISVSLKYGIPAVGAIATSLFCAAKLISGGKALIFGLASGWIINKIGELADDTRKHYSLQASIHRKKPTV